LARDALHRRPEDAETTAHSPYCGAISSPVCSYPTANWRCVSSRSAMASTSSQMREALAQLASQGLVQQSNRRGFRLPPLSAAHPVDVLLGKLADRRHRTSARSVTV